MESSASAGHVASAVLDPRRWWALALLCGAFFMMLLDGTITIVALPAWLIGGPLVDGPGWRWIFFINVPVGLAALALSPVLLRESRAALTRRSHDPAGALTITGALILLVYAVVEAPGAGWGDVRTILPLAGSAVLVAAFALIESRHPAPLVPLRIFRSRTLAGADALTILIGAVAVGMPFVLTLYAQQVLGYSALKFGISSVVLALGATAGAIAGQAAVGQAGFRPAAATGLALMAAGRSCSRRSPHTAATSWTSSSGCSCAAWGSAWPS